MAETPTPKRWYRLTPDRLVVALLAVEGLLLLSEWFRWFPFNQHKGWTVLIAVAAVGLTLVSMLLWFAAALIFRWRFQYSLRSLMFLVVAVAIPCSWLATERQRARRQGEAVAAIVEDTGRMSHEGPSGTGPLRADFVYDSDLRDYNDEGPFGFSWANLYRHQTGRGWYYTHSDEPRAPKWLRDLLGEDFFRIAVALNVESDPDSAREVDGAYLRRVTQIDSLKWLGLDDATGLTDADFLNLTRFRHLERLFLKNTQLTDAGLANLAGLTNLHYLSLSGTKVTDEGLVHLRGMTRLEMLDLEDTNISDAGLKHLAVLKGLKVVYLYGTKVTKKGAEELQAALPDCDVDFCGAGIVG